MATAICTVSETLPHAWAQNGFYASSKYWLFYCDNGYLKYRTSSDGSSWSSASSIRAVTDPDGMSIHFDGSSMHYAVVESIASGQPLYYRKGSPQSDGLISWSASEQEAMSSSSTIDRSMLAISVKDGYPWIGFNEGRDVNQGKVTKSSATDGSWTTDSGFPIRLGDVWQCRTAIPIPLSTADQVYVLYPQESNRIDGKLWDDGTWGSEEVIDDSGCAPIFYFDAVASNDEIHLVYAKNAGNLYYRKRSASGWSSTSTVHSVTSAVPPSLAFDPSSGELYLFWSENDHIYYKKRTNGTWDNSATDWIDESSEGLAGSVVAWHNSYNNEIIVSYTTGSGLGPYNLKFATLSLGGLEKQLSESISISESFQRTFSKILSKVESISLSDIFGYFGGKLKQLAESLSFLDIFSSIHSSGGGGNPSLNSEWDTGDINTRTTWACAIIDRDHDGTPHIIAPVRHGVKCFTSSGTLEWTYTGITQGYDVRDLEIGDLNGTGFNDCVVIASGYYTNSTHGKIAIVDKDGNELEELLGSDFSITVGRTYAVAVDGTDIYVSHDNGLTKFHKSGSSWVEDWSAEIGPAYKVEVHDLGNGKRILVARGANTSQGIYCYTSTGTQDWYFSTGNQYTRTYAVGNVDSTSSGYEVVVPYQGGIKIVDKDGSQIGSITTGTNVRTCVTCYDCDDDGEDEIYFADMGQDLYCFERTGSQTYSLKYSALDAINASQYAGLTHYDIDGDGDDEIFVFTTDGYLYVYDKTLQLLTSMSIGHGQAGGYYESYQYNPCGIKFADTNNDGDDEIIISGGSGYVDVLSYSPGGGAGLYELILGELLQLSSVPSSILSKLRELTESLSLSDAFSKIASFSSQLADSVSLSDLFSSSLSAMRSLVESARISDVCTEVKESFRTLAESISLSDFYASVFRGFRILFDSLSVSESFSKLMNSMRNFSESLSLSDYISSIASKVKLLLESFSLGDVLARKLSLVKGEALQLIDAMSTQLELLRQESLGIIPELKKNLFYVLSESVGISDSLSRFLVFLKQESLGLSDAVSRNLSKIINLLESMDLADTISYLSGLLKQLSEVLSVQDAISRSFAKITQLVDTLNLSDLGSRMHRAVRLLSESLSALDAFSYQLIGALVKQLQESLHLSEVSSKLYTTIRMEGLSLYESLTSTAYHLQSLVEGLSIIDALSTFKGLLKNLLESLSVSESISFRGVYQRVKEEILVLADSAYRSLSTLRIVAESFSLSDALSSVRGSVVSLIEGLNVSDSFSRLLFKVQYLWEQVSLSEVVSSFVSYLKILGENLSIFETKVLHFERTLVESFSLLEEISKRIVLRIAELLSISETISHIARFMRTLAESLSVVDVFSSVAGLIGKFVIGYLRLVKQFFEFWRFKQYSEEIRLEKEFSMSIDIEE
ncbi:MAG: FG-GAP-like repeat-containing protein [Methanosarcinales archaeon]